MTAARPAKSGCARSTASLLVPRSPAQGGGERLGDRVAAGEGTGGGGALGDPG